MICPPLTITREELAEGLAMIDEVLAIADEYGRRLRSGARPATGHGRPNDIEAPRTKGAT